MFTRNLHPTVELVLLKEKTFTLGPLGERLRSNTHVEGYPALKSSSVVQPYPSQRIATGNNPTSCAGGERRPRGLTAFESFTREKSFLQEPQDVTTIPQQ